MTRNKEETTAANANLIAAATEMYEALKLWYAYERGSLKTSMPQLRANIIAALKKAEGKQ